MNVVIPQVAPGIQRIFIVGYIAPDYVATTEDVVADFGQRPHGTVDMVDMMDVGRAL